MKALKGLLAWLLRPLEWLARWIYARIMWTIFGPLLERRKDNQKNKPPRKDS